MTVLLDVCDYGGPYGGSFIPTLAAEGRAARERFGLRHVCVFTNVAHGRPWHGLLEAQDAEVIVLDEGGRSNRARRLTSIATDLDAKLVRSHFTTLDVEAAYAGRRAGAGVLWQIHTGTLQHGCRRRASDLVKVRMLGRGCDRLVAVSDEIGRQARRRGFPASKVRIVPNGLDTARFAAERLPDRAEARRALGVPDEAQMLLAFGWSPYQKGIDLVLEAAGRLAGRRPIVTVLVGEQPLRAYVDARHSDSSPWLAVHSPVQDVRSFYAAADVFVSASRQEAFSFAIGEAMAAGLPVVSSDIPGPDGYFGAPGVRTFASGDAGALQAALEAQLDARSGSAGNPEFVRERFGLERHVDTMLGVFGELLGDPSGPMADRGAHPRTSGDR